MKHSILGQDKEGAPVSINIERLVETRMLIQANSGAGKSWAIRRILEQTYGRIQHLVIDVEDEFHTLRETFDYVLAGRHGGDCPADVRSAQLLARRLLELGTSAIIGIYELKAHDRIRFARLFLESLIDAPRNLWHPVLVVVDEAHMFCPQNGEAESASAVKDLMTRGRKRGFCGVLAVQRLSKLHKDAAAEANNKLIGRSALDVDMARAADELGFSAKDDKAKLRTLQPGQFFVFGPAISDVVIEVKIGPVETTHPKAGQRATAPAPPPETVRKVLAQLADLPKEAEQEAQTTTELRRRVLELERELRAKPKPEAPAPPKIQRVEVPVLKDKHAKSIEAAAERFSKATEQVASITGNILAELKKLRAPTASPKPVPVRSIPVPVQSAVKPVPSPPASSNGHISPLGHKLLAAMATAREIGQETPSRSVVAFLAGYSLNGHVKNTFGALRASGYIEYPSADQIALTDAGAEQIEPPERPASLDEYHALVHKVVKAPLSRKLLQVVIDGGPGERLDRAAVAEAAGQSLNGHVKNTFGALRSLGLIDYPNAEQVEASATLFPEGLV